MFKQKNVLISFAVSLLVAACGGGGGGSSSSDTASQPTSPTGSNNQTSTTTGKVVDGYIAGAAVVCDSNNNGVRDPGEQTVLTDGQGSFTFPAACSSTIIASGGADITTKLPFRGVLKAPAGSIVVTSGTTLLVNTSLANDKLATALGLPAGTDITTLDPAAPGAGGTLANATVLQRTLAVQQIVQQIADTIAALAQTRTTSQVQAIYAEAAKAAGTVLQNAATPLVSASGTVDPAAVNAIVQQALANVAASADAKLADTKTSIATFSKPNVAALVSPAIAAQAQTLATSANSDALTKTTQANTTVADAARQIAALLKSAVSNNVNLGAAAATLNQLASATAADAKAAAALKLALDIDTQSLASATAASLDTTTLNMPDNFLDIVANVIKINVHEGFDLGDLAANKVSFNAGTPPTINTIAIQVDPNGMAPDTGVKTIQVSLAFELADTGGNGQIFQMEIDKVNLSINAQNQVSVAIPPDAKMFVFGKNAAGATSNLTLANLPADLVTASSTTTTTPPTSTTNLITINTGTALAQAIAGNSAVFSGFQTIKGKLSTKLAISNVDLRQAGRAPAPSVSILVNGADQPAVTGQGFQSILTIQ